MSVARDIMVNTLLGAGSSLRGDLTVDGFVRIDGDFRGSLRSSGKVVISELARCEANIVARSAVIGGVIRGDVCVSESLTLLDGGVVVGNVFAPRLDAPGDVLIHGNIEVSGKKEGVIDAMLAFLKRHNSSLRPFSFDLESRPAEGRRRWQK